MGKNLKKLLIVVFFLALTDSSFYNLLELWLKDNNMSISTISRVLSLCAFITVSVIFLASNIVKSNHIKKFTIILISIRVIDLLLLFILYQSGFVFFIKLRAFFCYEM